MAAEPGCASAFDGAGGVCVISVISVISFSTGGICLGCVDVGSSVAFLSSPSLQVRTRVTARVTSDHKEKTFHVSLSLVLLLRSVSGDEVFLIEFHILAQAHALDL